MSSLISLILLIFLITTLILTRTSTHVHSYCLQPACVAPENSTSTSSSIVIRPITLVIGHTWLHNRTMITVNGTSPGPTIIANENDVLVITVKNYMTNATTTVHWHGLYHYQTSEMDGVVGVSQCPIVPGSSFTYRFRALPSGTFWYHGHVDGQYTDGLYGAFIIHRAGGDLHQEKYQDDFTIMAADYYKQPYHIPLAWYLSSASFGVEPIPDAILLNGVVSGRHHIYASKSHPARIRFINAAALSMFFISIDGVPIKVIEVDGVSVVPYELDRFSINVAQRVSVLVDFSKVNITGPIYLRVTPDTTMYAIALDFFKPPYNPTHSLDLNPVGIIHLDETSENQPNYKVAPTITAEHTFGQDDNLLDVRPVEVVSIPSVTHNLTMLIDFFDSTGIRLGYLNNVTLDIHDLETNDITTPILWEEWKTQQYTTTNGNGNENGNGNNNNIHRGEQNKRWYFPFNSVVDILLFNNDGAAHPFHYHGHSFWVVATSEYPEAETKYAGAYVRRDVVTVPAQGWAKIRVVSNNPGVWMFHCHIDWHMSAGLAAIFVTAPEQLPFLRGPSVSDDRVCQEYAKYRAGPGPHQTCTQPQPQQAASIVNINFQGLFVHP